MTGPLFSSSLFRLKPGRPTKDEGPMFLAMLRLELRFNESPRGKRRTVQAILDKIHRHFNVSVAEVDRSNHPTESVLGIAAISTTRKEVREVLDRVADAVAAHPRAEVILLELTEL